MALTAAAVFIAGPAAAQDGTSRSMPVTGNAPQICAVQAGSLQPGVLINIAGTSGDTLQIIQLVDPSTLSVQSARATVEMDAMCNFPHRLRMESQNNGMWPIEEQLAATRTDFASSLPYQAQVAWADTTGSLQTDAQIRRAIGWQADIDSPAAGKITIDFVLEAGASNTQANAPLLAGAYGDTLRIFLEPR